MKPCELCQELLHEVISTSEQVAANKIAIEIGAARHNEVEGYFVGVVMAVLFAGAAFIFYVVKDRKK